MDRARARALAQDAIARGKALSWFEALYREADAGTAVVPWADLVPNPHLVAWLDANPTIGGRALDVGTGFLSGFHGTGTAVLTNSRGKTCLTGTTAGHPDTSIEITYVQRHKRHYLIANRTAPSRSRARTARSRTIHQGT